MTDAAHARPARKLIGVVLAAVVALVVPAVAIAAPPAGKGPAPSSPVASVAFSFNSVDLPDTPGTEGLAYVVASEPFSVRTAFLDAAGQPVAFSENSSTRVWLEYGGARIGSAVDVAGGAETASFTGLTISTPVSGVRLTLVADTKPRTSSYASDAFDVLIDDEGIEPGLRTSIGGDGGTDTECNATAAARICADLVPPAGGFAEAGRLARGLCARDDDCRVEYVQALVPFVGADGVGGSPATLIMKCDKAECGGGAIRKQQLNVTLSPNPDSDFAGTFTAPACPAKGTVGFDPSNLPITDSNLPFCVDYVQSTRDNAGDTFLYLLFVVDAKVRFL